MKNTKQWNSEELLVLQTSLSTRSLFSGCCKLLSSIFFVPEPCFFLLKNLPVKFKGIFVFVIDHHHIWACYVMWRLFIGRYLIYSEYVPITYSTYPVERAGVENKLLVPSVISNRSAGPVEMQARLRDQTMLAHQTHPLGLHRCWISGWVTYVWCRLTLQSALKPMNSSAHPSESGTLSSRDAGSESSLN